MRGVAPASPDFGNARASAGVSGKADIQTAIRGSTPIRTPGDRQSAFFLALWIAAEIQVKGLESWVKMGE
jgi:hypothetical protein